MPVVCAENGVARPLSESPLPPGMRIVAVRRANRSFAPDGATALRSGDWVSVVVPNGERPSALELRANGQLVPMPG